MASVYQRKGKWLARFKNERGLWSSRSCGGADKATSLRWAVTWENEARDIREGRVDPRADDFRQHEARPIDEHVVDFEAMLLAKGDTARYATETVAYIRRVVNLVKASRISDLTADSVRKAIATVRDSGRSLRTCNAMLTGAKTFTGWLASDRRSRHDDLKALKRFNVATDRRRIRRDLEDDELVRLIDAAESGQRAFGLSGPERAMAYRIAAGTGFRRGEIRSLTPQSFDLAGDEPTISVMAGYSKHRRDDRQPIDLDLAAVLKTWLVDKPKGVRLFALSTQTAEMLRHDLGRARAKWLREEKNPQNRRERRKSDFLAVVDDGGRVFDFHSLRHHYISKVVSSGASVKTCQELARHSTPTLTIGLYSHVRLHDLRAAVPKVPGTKKETDPQAAILRATGTCDGRAALARQIGRDTVRGGATHGDEMKIGPTMADTQKRSTGVADCDVVRGGALTNDERTRQDSNLQLPDYEAGQVCPGGPAMGDAPGFLEPRWTDEFQDELRGGQADALPAAAGL